MRVVLLTVSGFIWRSMVSVMILRCVVMLWVILVRILVVAGRFLQPRRVIACLRLRLCMPFEKAMMVLVEELVIVVVMLLMSTGLTAMLSRCMIDLLIVATWVPRGARSYFVMMTDLL